MPLYDARGQPVTLDRRIGGGGEGDVYLVAGRPDVVAKVYTKATPNLRDKLAWMIDHPPEMQRDTTGHTTLAWPSALLYADRTRVVFTGFLMPHVAGAAPLLQVFNPRLRTRTLPGFDRRYLARTARNLAAVLATLHRSGYVVGDLNESNVLVTPTALVAVIDCDSFQVQAVRGGQVATYPCPVGKLEYTAPELQGKPFGQELRRPEADRFALGVLIFQLLMEGRHPFAGTWTGSGEPPAVEEKIRRGCFPYTDRPACPILPPPNAPTLGTLPPPVADLMRRCFIAGQRNPPRRPAPEVWRDILSQAEGRIGATAAHRPSISSVSAPTTRPAERAVEIVAPRPAPRPRSSSPPRTSRTRAAVAKRPAAVAAPRRTPRSNARELLAMFAGITILLGTTLVGGWWLLDRYGIAPFGPPAPTATARPASVVTPVPATGTTAALASGACTPRTAAAAASTAAARARPATTPLAGSWVARSPGTHVRFFGMPWWDDLSAPSRGAYYAVGVPPGEGDRDRLDVLRVAGVESTTGVAAWQNEFNSYIHRSTAGNSGGINAATITGGAITTQPRLRQVAGYDGYLGQFHFTADGGSQVDATLWVGQVGCDRLILVFTGPPTRDRFIDQAVTQVLGTIDLNAS